MYHIETIEKLYKLSKFQDLRWKERVEKYENNRKYPQQGTVASNTVIVIKFWLKYPNTVFQERKFDIQPRVQCQIFLLKTKKNYNIH